MSVRISWRKTVLAAALLALASCGDAGTPAGPVTPPADPLLLGDGPLGLLSPSLLKCAPQEYVKVTREVGPAGGVIEFGAHRLEVPKGALDRPVTITAEAMPEAGNAVRFGPEGLRFAVRAPLRLSYANCQPSLLPKAIVYTDNLLRILELLQTLDDKSGKAVTARLDHFSRYAVAW